LTKFVKRVVAIRDGKTSSEMIMKSDSGDLESLAAWGEMEDTHEEYAVLDRAGRVQIPEDFLKKLDLPGNRVKLALDDDTVKMSRPGDGK
jgi:hypothetical protein